MTGPGAVASIPAVQARATRITGEGALGHLAAAGWDELASACPPADPTRTAAWLAAWRATVGGASSPRAVLVDRERRLVAAAALEEVRRGGVRVVRFMGQGDPWFAIDPPARDASARERLLEAIASEPGDILQLDGLRGDRETWDLLRDAVPGVRLSLMTTWRLTLAEPPRSMRKRRKEAGRARRRASDRGSTLSVTVASDWAEIAPRLRDLLDLHDRHFPGPERNLLAGAGPRRAFAERAITAMGAEGRVRLVEVGVEGGEMVAWDLALVSGTYAVAYAGAIDRSRDDLPSLGWISVLAMIEALGEEGVEVLDFGSGPAAYKDLVAVDVPLVRALAPLSRLGRGALAAHRAAVAGRRAAERARAVALRGAERASRGRP